MKSPKKCDEVIDRILEGEETSLGEISEHIASCPSCSRLAALASELAGQGRRLREEPMRPEAEARLRARALEVLESARRKSPSPVREWLVSAWRPALAACAVALLAGAALLLLPFEQDARQIETAEAERQQPAGLRIGYDEEIYRLKRRLDARLRRFENRYLASNEFGEFERRTAALEDRIDFYAARVRREM